MKTLLLFASALLMLAACNPRMTSEVIETEAALCDVWQDSLPTRSKADTPETIEGIGRAYDVFEAVCERAAF